MKTLLALLLWFRDPPPKPVPPTPLSVKPAPPEPPKPTQPEAYTAYTHEGVHDEGPARTSGYWLFYRASRQPFIVRSMTTLLAFTPRRFEN